MIKILILILAKCKNKDLECYNEGFVDFTCKCKCPNQEITGEYCEKIDSKPGIKYFFKIFNLKYYFSFKNYISIFYNN